MQNHVSIPAPFQSQLTSNPVRESLGEGGSIAAAAVIVVLFPVEDHSSAGIAPPPLSPVTQDLFRPP